MRIENGMKICTLISMTLWNKIILTVAFAGSNLAIKAGVVDTIITYSHAMHKDVKSVIILPNSYADSSKNYPVIYLLHGYAGNYSNWITIAPQLQSLVDEYQMIIVCADGGSRSWYIDSPMDTTFKYETYIVKELIPDIDARYRTIENRNHRAISGLSMGGHGGLFLGIKHKKLFGAAGSMSGGLDLLQHTATWKDKQKLLGDTTVYKQNWTSHSVIYMMDYLKNGELKMIIDCGVDDYFIGINRAINQKLLNLKIAHDYIERPGSHNHQYWTNSINYQLLYFHLFFEEQLN